MVIHRPPAMLESPVRPDIVVEVMGGIEPARTSSPPCRRSTTAPASSPLTRRLLAQDGASTCTRPRDAAGADLYFEASVAGAIPLASSAARVARGRPGPRVLGIVNGTTNYILTRMEEIGASFEDALAEPKAGLRREPDPSADVDGHDAAAKAAIIASLAFHSRVTLNDVFCEGISSVTAEDIEAARSSGHAVKLLAVAERESEGRGINVRVHPAMVPLIIRSPLCARLTTQSSSSLTPPAS